MPLATLARLSALWSTLPLIAALEYALLLPFSQLRL